MNSDITWVNNLKVLGIAAVILGHINNPFNEFIYSWHMPLFFILSGFFIKTDKNLIDLISKDWKRLMIPYFIFSALAIAIESVKRFGLRRETLDYINELQAVFVWMDMEHLINSYAFVLWFLPTLFFSKIFYYLVVKKISNLLFQLCVFISLFLFSFYINLPFALSNAMNSVVWIFIGVILFKISNNSFKINNVTIHFKVIASLSALTIVGMYLYTGIPSLDMSKLRYEQIILNLFWASSLVVLLIWFTKTLQEKRVESELLKLWGSGTMMLFILHPYTNNIAHLAIEKFFYGNWMLKLALSMALLHIVLLLKHRFSKKWIFKYV